MLRLSVGFKSKELCSVGYGSMGCDDNNEWSVGGPDDEQYSLVLDMDWWGLGLAIDSPYKRTRRLKKR